MTHPKHAQKVAEAQRRRLEVLELQIAQLGLTAPPHLVTEAEDLRARLAGEALVEPISDEERYRSVMRAVMLLSQQVAAIETVVETKYNRLIWLLPALLFAYLILEWIVRHL